MVSINMKKDFILFYSILKEALTTVYCHIPYHAFIVFLLEDYFKLNVNTQYFLCFNKDN